MIRHDDAKLRSMFLSESIGRREDEELEDWIKSNSSELDFKPLEQFMISEKAWEQVKEISTKPQLVFAHPTLLQQNPKVSKYYRGISLLSQKQVEELAFSVSDWEKGVRSQAVTNEKAIKIVRLYNSIVSSIIEGHTGWTLDNGYRNIIATMGISLDGTFRNMIGQSAEKAIKNRIRDWVEMKDLVLSKTRKPVKFELNDGITMRYGSEPDIEFTREGQTIVTIEVKGGKDPAGALERLGAMQKSFSETPPGCVNILIAGVVTAEMQARLDQIGTVKVYLLDDISLDESKWNEFIEELFHYTLRLI
ncbi:MAG: XcyI family restriction endonuclease [Gammaproteobacteria bacterium]|nr:XcyI family restriction endonuclease [Gammaproteobacteria bacterium]MYK05140.1 XcyI family restriction endonuclease [Gammaproteobacteria bacterium]